MVNGSEIKKERRDKSGFSGLSREIGDRSENALHVAQAVSLICLQPVKRSLDNLILMHPTSPSRAGIVTDLATWPRKLSNSIRRLDGRAELVRGGVHQVIPTSTDLLPTTCETNWPCEAANTVGSRRYSAADGHCRCGGWHLARG
jgi:hypothetical protein